MGCMFLFFPGCVDVVAAWVVMEIILCTGCFLLSFHLMYGLTGDGR